METVIRNRTYSMPVYLDGGKNHPEVKGVNESGIRLKLHVKEARGRMGIHMNTRIVHYDIEIELSNVKGLSHPVRIQVAARKSFKAATYGPGRKWIETLVGSNGSKLIDVRMDAHRQHQQNSIKALNGFFDEFAQSQMAIWSFIDVAHKNLDRNEPEFKQLFPS